MKLLCKYYSNQARLANSVLYMSAQPSFRYFCVSGMLVKNKKEFQVLTPTVTLVLACVLPNTGKNSMMLLTSDPTLREQDGKVVDTATIDHDPIFYNLCVLLQEKYKNNHSAVTIEFKGEHMSVVVSISEVDDGALQCTVRGADGSIVVHGQRNIRDMLRQCHLFHSFRYMTETAECQREVTVRKSRAEILKEVSRYLNRTLVIVSFQQDGSMLEQYISVSGMLEVITREDGARSYRKATGSRLRDANSFCLYQSTSRIEDIMREQGSALSHDKRG